MLLAALGASAFAAAYLSAAVGIGGGTLFIVLLYTILPPTLALPLHGAVQLFNNALRLYFFRQDVLPHVVKPFLLTVLPAVGLGWLLLGVLNPTVLRGLLGVFVLVAVLRPRIDSPNPSAKGWAGLGFSASLSSILVGAADPVIAPFFLGDRFRREEVIATKAACQLATHVPKVALFIALGGSQFAFSYGDHLPSLAVMMGAVVLGVIAGKRTRVPEQLFRRLFRILLGLLGAKLLLGAVFGF